MCLHQCSFHVIVVSVRDEFVSLCSQTWSSVHLSCLLSTITSAHSICSTSRSTTCMQALTLYSYANPHLDLQPSIHARGGQAGTTRASTLRSLSMFSDSPGSSAQRSGRLLMASYRAHAMSCFISTSQATRSLTPQERHTGTALRAIRAHNIAPQEQGTQAGCTTRARPQPLHVQQQVTPEDHRTTSTQHASM